MKRCMIVPVLLLCLLLTACGGGEDSGGRDSVWSELGIEENEILLTVDGREVPAWRYCRWLAAGTSTILAEYEDAGLTVDWEETVEDSTLDAYICRRALEDTVLYATVENWAEEYGVTVTEKAEADAAGLPLPLTRAQAEELERVGLLYGGLCTLAAREDSPLVTGETLAAWGAALGYMTVDRVLFAAGEDREAARQRAEEAFARLNQAVEKGPVFESLAAGGDDLAGPRTLRAGDGTLDASLETAAAALEAEQYSGILESEEGFSILRRLPLRETVFAVDWLDDALLAAAEKAEVKTTENFQSLRAADMAAVLEKEGS